MLVRDPNSQPQAERGTTGAFWVKTGKTGPVQIPVPFIGQPVEAGDAIAKVTQALGIRHCGGCERRRRILNERIRLAPFQQAGR